MERKCIESDTLTSRRNLSQTNRTYSAQRTTHTFAVDEVMEKCTRLIQKKDISAYKKIQILIHNQLSDKCKSEIVNWKDDDGLNIVHYAIIFRRPEILQYLLHDSKIFPVDSQPTICPYAHLAAFIGVASCIKIILTHRPNDSFKSHLPEHQIKLPDHIIKLAHIQNNRNYVGYREMNERIADFYFQNQNVFDKAGRRTSDDIVDLMKFLQENMEGSLNSLQLPSIHHMKVHLKPISKHLKLISYPKTYKELLTVEIKNATKPTSIKTQGKGPLMIAAENCHLDTVKAILEMKYAIRKSGTFINYLTAATKSVSPEAIATLLTESKIDCQDYQNACLEAIRNLYPDCLIALLSSPPTKCKAPFGGVNLYHMLYSQTLDTDEQRYEMLPIMTRALVFSGKDVNDCTIKNTFPLHSLITCSFNLQSTRRLYTTFDSLKYLLHAGANPCFNEIMQKDGKNNTITREPYTSGYHCIFENALKKFNSCLISNTDTRVPKTIMTHSVLFLCKLAKRSKKVPPEVLFEYLEKACHFGLDEQLIETLISSGANPDLMMQEKFALNAYFDTLFLVFPDWQKGRSHDFYRHEMELLMTLCRHMQINLLSQAVRSILKQYKDKNIPVGTVLVTRYFLYLADNLIKGGQNYASL